MGMLGLQGAVRGKKPTRRRSRTTRRSGPPIWCNRQFQADAPQPAVGGGPHLRRDLGGFGLSWPSSSMSLPDASSAGGCASSMRTDLVLDALEQALWSRTGTEGLVHHSDRGVQYLSIRYTERLAEAGIESSVGSVGDSYDNALAETIIGLFKTEVIRRRGPWRTIDAVEYATLEWVDWFNNRRLLEPIGNIPPAEFEQAYYRQLEESAMAA